MNTEKIVFIYVINDVLDFHEGKKYRYIQISSF